MASIASAGGRGLPGRVGAGLRNRLSAQNLVVWGVVLIVATLVLVPLAYLFWITFLPDWRFSLGAFQRAYGRPEDLVMVRNSLVYATGTMVVSILIGGSLSFLSVRTNLPGKSLVFLGLMGALIMPGTLYAMAWIQLGSPRAGVLSAVVEPVLGPERIDIFSMWGMVLASSLHFCPIVYLLFAASFRSLDPSLEESALVGGASYRRIIRSITLPLLKPTILSSVLLMFIIGLQIFEIPAIIGSPGGISIFTARIRRLLGTFPPDYAVAGAFAFSMLAIIVVAVLLQSRFTKRGQRFQTVSGKAFRPREIDLGRWRWPLFLVAFGVVAFAFLLPMLAVVYTSIQPYLRTPTLDSLGDSNLDAYRSVLDSSLTLRAARNSLVSAVASATVVMALMAVASWVVIRSRSRGRWLLEGLATMPLLIPGIVLSLALLVFYLRVPNVVYGTIWILIIAYATQYMPFGMRYASSSMFQIASELEEAAAVSGATWLQTFRRVFLPLLAPGLLAGWVFIVVIASRDLATVVLLYSPGTEVLQVAMFQRWLDGEGAQAAALGVMLVAVLLVIVGIAHRLGRGIGLRA